MANELDENVVNIFRAAQFIELAGTKEQGRVDGLNIFALTTADIIKILEEGIKDLDILPIINEGLDSKPVWINSGWRGTVLDNILVTK